MVRSFTFYVETNFFQERVSLTPGNILHLNTVVTTGWRLPDRLTSVRNELATCDFRRSKRLHDSWKGGG